jgi:PhnB protein
MLKLNPYLNFLGKTEEAFNFYKSVFGGGFVGKISRFKDVPDLPNKDQMSEEDLNKVMHVALMIGDNMLMATDALESQGQTLTVGNNISLSLHPDTKEEADRLFAALGEGGRVDMPLQDMFWGDYFGMLTDQFGIQWMVNFQSKK